jgi:hypothetical protein
MISSPSIGNAFKVSVVKLESFVDGEDDRLDVPPPPWQLTRATRTLTTQNQPQQHLP